MDAFEVQKRLRELKSLASPPAALDRILELLADPQSDIERLAAAIEHDPALAARLLRLANSAYFGLASQVESIRKAIVVLGYRTVENLATCVALAPVFRGEGEIPDRRRIWLHSCATAEAARIAAHLLELEASAAYTAGLLHDIGQVALAEIAPQEYARTVLVSERRKTSLAAAERDRLGIDHAAAGKLLAETWGLPERTRGAIGGHDSSAGSSLPLVRVVRTAEHVATELGWPGLPGDVMVPGGWSGSTLGLTTSQCEELRSRLEQRREAIELLHRESWRREP